MNIDARLIETIVEDLDAEASYADMLAHPETVVDAFDLSDAIPVSSRPHYRDDVSEAYDLGYERGFINAPRAEHDECYESAGWLLGWEDGMADWDGQRGFRDT